MSFLPSLFALSGYLDFPRSFWGWLLGVSFLVVLVLVGRRFRVHHPKFNRTRWLLFAALLVITPFTSIYFGLLTALAMMIALFAALTLLPQLFIFFKPLGPENRVE